MNRVDLHRVVASIVALCVVGCGSAPRERTTDTSSAPRSPVASGATTAPAEGMAVAPSPRSGPSSPPVTSARPSASPDGSPARAPLGGSPLIEIEVEGHGPAVVAVPVGATTPQPVVLATHGNYDHPEWQCSTWRAIVGPEAFVLCPRGIPRPDSPSLDDVRFTYTSNAALEVEIEAALAALRARFGAHVAEAPVVYTGFSLGAIMGVAIASRAKHPGRYESMVLVEGGHDRWTPATARAFAAGGGKRVLFACGQASCLLDAKRASARLEAAGVTTRIVGVKDAGHSYGGAVSREVQAAWPFVLAEPTTEGGVTP